MTASRAEWQDTLTKAGVPTAPIQSMDEVLAHPQTEALEILRGLVDSVTLIPIERGFEIELVGEIAKMITLPEGSGSVHGGDVASSVKVVAGARNYLNLLLFISSSNVGATAS